MASVAATHVWSSVTATHQWSSVTRDESEEIKLSHVEEMILSHVVANSERAQFSCAPFSCTTHKCEAAIRSTVAQAKSVFVALV